MGQRTKIGIGAAVIALAIGGGAVLYLRQQQVAPDPVVAVTAPPPVVVPERPAPSQAESDTLVRTWGAKLSSSSLIAKWLEGRDLARQFVAAVQTIADGESPRQLLTFLAPTGGFEVEERGEASVVSNTSFARYDFVAEAVDSVSVEVAAAAWPVVEPVLSAVYREIAPPGASLNAALGKAITVLVTAPVPQGEVEVVEKGASFLYADPSLEALSPAQKHLVRMGPRNQQRIQEKLRALQTALGLTVASR